MSKHATLGFEGMEEKAQSTLVEFLEGSDHGAAAKKRKTMKLPNVPDPQAQLEPGQQLQPRTVVDEANELMNKLLDEAALARKHAIALRAYGLSAESKAKLETFAKFADSTYTQLQDMKMQKKMDAKELKNIILKAKEQRDWFDNIKPVHESMMRGLKVSPKAKGKAKAKPIEKPQ